VRSTALRFLDDILEAIGNIEKETAGIPFEEFAKEQRRHDAVIRNFKIIGEAIRHLPADLKARYPKTDWKKITRLYDLPSHAYSGVTPMILWDTSINKIPELKTEIRFIHMNEEEPE